MLALGACAKSDSEAIKDVVKSFFGAWNDRDFDRCLELFSRDLGYSEDDIEDMRDSREMTGEITITKLEEPVITGSTATIDVEITSSDQGSDSFEIPLVKEDGDWKLME